MRGIAVLACLGWIAVATAEATRAAPPPLDAPVHALWTGLPLATWAERVTGVAGGRPFLLVIDRRIDPEAPVSRDARGEPLRAVLEGVAADVGATVEVLSDSVWLVPRERAGVASRAEAARRAEVAKLPATERSRLAQAAAWAWPAGSRPRDLVGASARANGLRLDGLDSIPHDHIRAATLPPLDLPARLDLVLAGYDLRVRWQSAHVARIVPIETDLPPAGRATAAAVGNSRPPARTATTERFSLRLAAPLDQAVAAIAGRFGLRPEINRASLAARGVQPGEIVRVEVSDVPRDAILDALVAPLGLRWRIDGDMLVVDAPEPEQPDERRAKP